MSTPLEHDYIGLSEVSSMENSGTINFTPKKPTLPSKNALKTELSLGLPGSESPERRPSCGVTIFGKEFEGKSQIGSIKVCGSGAKRGFSDAIDGCEKWVFNVNGKSDCNLSKDGCVKNFGGVDNNNSSAQKLGLLKDVNVNSCTKPVQKQPQVSVGNEHASAPASKTQVVGWPPIRSSFRKNTLVSSKNNEQTEEKSGAPCLYVKVSMDGAPYLRKVDLQTYGNYKELSFALEKMFNCFITGQNAANGRGKQDGLGEGQSTDLQNAENVLTYEDKDGDWMLVGDVPWRMFTENCRKLRIMKGSEAIGLAPNAGEKCKSEA